MKRPPPGQSSRLRAKTTFAMLSALTITMCLMLTSWPVAGQGGGNAQFVLTADNGAASTSYNAPTTAWGDPDLQGVWSSDDLRGVPLQRDPQFGTRLYLTDAEYADRLKRDEQTRMSAHLV